MRLIIWTCVGFVLAGGSIGGSMARAYEPTKNYQEHKLSGFTVLICPAIVKDAKTREAVVRELDVQLQRIENSVPDKALTVIRRVKIWVEAEQVENIVAWFMPGDAKVRKEFKNPAKANSIEILGAARFLDNSERGMRTLLLHELAHGYQHLALGKQLGAIQTAYKQAVDRKLYDDVEHFNGARGRGYAIKNEWEYFATLSEAYFGRSFNFPYDRSGLLRYDTAGYWLMVETWGKSK